MPLRVINAALVDQEQPIDTTLNWFRVRILRKLPEQFVIVADPFRRVGRQINSADQRLKRAVVMTAQL
jgi:hypothetical protein